MSALTWVKSGKFIGARDLRGRLAHVIKSRKAYFVTEHGKPVKAMVPYAMFMELLEAIEELKDGMLLREVALGRAEYAKGRFKPLATLKGPLRKRG